MTAKQRAKEKAKAAKAKAKAKKQKEKAKVKAKKEKEKQKAKAKKQKEKDKAKAARYGISYSQYVAERNAYEQEQEAAKARRKAAHTFEYDSLSGFPVDSARHYLGFYGNVGYSRHTFRQDGIRTQGFVGGGIGFGYKLRYKLFRMDISLEGQYMGNHLTGDLTVVDPVEAPSPTMLYKYQFQHLVEQQHVVSAVLPVMLGVENEKGYCLLGVRLAMPVWTRYSSMSDVTREITDLRLIDGFTDMDWHLLYSDQVQSANQMLLRFNPQLAFEAGWNLDRYIRPKRAHYEIGILAQVGMRDYRNVPTKSFVETNADAVASLTSVANAKEMASTTMLPWMVGVKFGIYYDLKRKPKQVQEETPIAPAIVPVEEEEEEEEVEEEVVEIEETVVVADTAVYNGHVVKTGEKVVLQSLYFATDKTEVLPSSQAGLDALYQMLRDYPNIRVRIVGHTDNTNTAAYNQRLSEGRANSVRKSMIKRGIEAWRMETEGKGLTEPIDTNETPEGRQNNRRVEFEIIE